MNVSDKLRFYIDGGHGWLAVPVGEVARAGVLRQVSTCSYHDRHTALLYLEEDCDAPLYGEATGLDPATVERVVLDGSCFIRKLSRLTDVAALADELGV